MSKVQELCKLMPFLDNELDRDRGKTKEGKNNVIYNFKNGSFIDILAPRESSRGQRRTGLVIEEAILIDKDALNEIIIPTTNVDRNLPDGTTDPDEVVNQSQIYITSAGWKNSFPYAKLIEILINSILYPDDYMMMGGDYLLAIIEGAAKKDFVNKLKADGTYASDSFDREYGSIWCGDIESSFYSFDEIEKHRVLKQVEHEFSGRSAKSAYYVLGVDVGRKNDTTEIVVLKATPQPQGGALVNVVNLKTIAATHFEEQAREIKKMFLKYKCRCASIDANGLGVGLIDQMVLAQVDPDTGETLPPFGVTGGTYEGAAADYKKYKSPDMIHDAMYLIKANAPINTEMYAAIKIALNNNRLKFLIDETSAKANLMSTKVGQQMTIEQRNEYLVPYQLTSNLRDQLLNLVQENDGVNTILKQNNRGIKKDKHSALCHGMYYIKLEDERKNKRKSFNIADLCFVN